MKNLSDGNNFYRIRKDNLTFWGMDIRAFETKIDENLKKLINIYELPYDEVIEINEMEDYVLYETAMKKSYGLVIKH